MNMNEVRRRPSRNIRTQSESTNKVIETSNVTQEEAKVEENPVNLETNDNEFFNQVIKSGVEAIKNEQAQRELIYNSLIIGEAISGKIDKVSSTLNVVKNDLPIQQKWRQATSKNIAELEDKISEIPKEVEGNVMFEIRRIFNNIEELGNKYGRVQREQLENSIKEVNSVINKGKEGLEFWSLGKKIVLCILLGMLSFQIYYNYKMTAKLENLNEQVGLIHSVYKGESKYWFDANDHITYVEYIKSHQERNKK